MIPPIRPPELPSFHPTASPKRPADVAAPSQLRRPIALIEVIICSGFPSQLALAVLLGILGLRAVNQAGELSFAYVVTLSLTDTAVLIACIFYFLGLHHEPVLQFFLGPRTRRLEVALGVALTPLMVLAALAGVAAIQQISPALHNVPENPLQALLRSPAHVLVFTLVAMVAGGLREELQRAFILRRFEQHLGGAWLGLVIFSVAFGLGHQIQGWDVAIVTGALGAIWGAIYLVRRSVVAPMVSHAGFNVTEILLTVLATTSSG